MPAVACALLFAAAVAQQQSVPAEEPSEIVVTGERVPRSLRETSSSVAVVGQDEIEASGADDVDQLLSLVPNVQLGNGSQGPAIRGLDSTGPLFALPAFLGGNRPRTTIIVDGRPVTYNELVFGTFGVWDVNRVEVFRSPQTTTQGQNSIAGAIFVNTNDPGFTPEYRARGIVGNYKTRQVSALASGPLGSDDVAFRIAGDFRYARTTSHILDEMEGADPNHEVYGLLRAKLLVNPAPTTRMTLTYAHTDSQSPQVVGVSAPFEERRDDLAGYGIFRVNVDSLTAAVRHDVSPDLTANVLLTAGSSLSRRFAFPGFGQTRINGRDWSGEAVVNWSPEGPLSAVAGASRRHVALRQFIDLSLLSGSIGRFRDWQDGSGLFVDVGLELSSRAKVTAGIRYQHDRQKRVGALTADTFVIPVDFVGKFDAWLPKVTFAYDLSPALRVGAMVQKAYNPGGTTIRVDTGRPDDFKAEGLWDYELFARGSAAGGALTFETNLFLYKMRDAQRFTSILIFTPSGRPAGFANLFNVPKARSYGAEGELRWRMSRAFSASLGVGLLGSKVLETDADSADFQGKEFDRSPHFTASAAIDWKPSDRLRVSAQVRHHSPYFTDPENTPEIRVDSATAVDARAEYRLNRITIFAQLRNVFDALNMLDVGAPDPDTGKPQFGEAEDPRMAAVGLEARF